MRRRGWCDLGALVFDTAGTKAPAGCGSNVRLRMEKPLSPELVALQVDSSGLEYTTIECTTCAGTGMIAPGVSRSNVGSAAEGTGG